VLRFTDSKKVTGDESIVARMSGLNHATRTMSISATIRCFLLLFLFWPPRRASRCGATLGLDEPTYLTLSTRLDRLGNLEISKC
jgi:hypothetical protein